MPRFGTFRYGQIAKYGAYTLVSTGKAIGPHIRYKMRNRPVSGTPTPYIIVGEERIEVPATGLIPQFRMRTNGGQWVKTQLEEVYAETFKVRIRSIESDGGWSPWVVGERGTLQS